MVEQIGNAVLVEKVSLSTIIEQSMEEAINYLVHNLTCQAYDGGTHLAVIVTGWNDTPEIKFYISQYLVGLRACAIDAALNIKAFLYDEDTADNRIDLYQDICTIVGEDNALLNVDQKEDERNPWLAEGLWHLCMTVASRKPEFHPPGNIIAQNYVHVKAKDHGLDGVALYEHQSELGLSIIESKAYKNDPNRAISKAVVFFKEIDNDQHAARIKSTVQVMRSALPPELQKKISSFFWKKNRTYIPNPHYDCSIDMNWTNKRPSFKEIDILKDNIIIIMPHIVEDFDQFFDDVSDHMRAFVKGLVENV